MQANTESLIARVRSASPDQAIELSNFLEFVQTRDEQRSKTDGIIDSKISVTEPELSEDPYRPPEKFIDESFKTTYQSMITFSTEALKLLGFANGGAAVALLSFAGYLKKSDGLASPLRWFAFGLFFCLVAFFSSYLCQMSLMKYWTTKEEAWIFSNLASSKLKFLHVFSSKWRARHVVWFIVVILAAIASLFSFVIGIFNAKDGLMQAATVIPTCF